MSLQRVVLFVQLSFFFYADKKRTAGKFQQSGKICKGAIRSLQEYSCRNGPSLPY